MNELSVFHYLIRNEAVHPIAYSVDRSQSLSDRGWNDESFANAFSSLQIDAETRTVIRSVFRCAPEIVNLAFTVTSAGATLFTNFDDPLKIAASAFTDQEERKSAVPTYSSYVNDEEMVEAAFVNAERLTREIGCSRHEVLIVAFDPLLMELLSRAATEMHKPVELITQRGDSEVVKRAERGGRFVLGSADYVGGLEFSGVILVGVDHGRVPPTRSQQSLESSNFLSYSAHSRLYVAITRAKYRVEILGVKDRGRSRLLGPAFANNALIEAQAP